MEDMRGPIRRAVDESIGERASIGALDPKVSAAPVAMLRKMADFLDDDMATTPAFRYVTPASFLSYCDALGLMPDVDARPAAADDGKGTRLTSMRGKFRAVGE